MFDTPVSIAFFLMLEPALNHAEVARNYRRYIAYSP
jgi:hypothetical protein